MSALVKTPECRATQEALIHEDNSLRLLSDCPVCALVGVRCPIGYHPLSAGMSYTSCSNLHLFPCSLIFLSYSLILPQTICTISISDYHSELPCMPAVGAGTYSSGFFPAVFPCSFFHDLGPWRDDQVVSCLRLFYFSPFCFCRSIFFLFHCVTLHPHCISISDAIRNSLSVFSYSCYCLLSFSIALFRIPNSSTCVPCLLQTMHFYAISVVGWHLELYDPCL